MNIPHILVALFYRKITGLKVHMIFHICNFFFKSTYKFVNFSVFLMHNSEIHVDNILYFQNPGITFTPLQAQVSATVTSTGNNGKSLAVSKGQTTPSTPTQQAQATTLIGGKPIMPTQTNIAAQPLVLSMPLFLFTLF